METNNTKGKNELYPVFLKLDKINTLIVGGGKIALEKLTSILANSPKAKLVLVAPEINKSIIEMSDLFENLVIIEKTFEEADLGNKELVILATNHLELHGQIKLLAEKRGILVNVADTPLLCDFYLGSIVQKGHVKIAISSNGKSPTLAKRLKEVLQDTIPNDIDRVAENLGEIRHKLNGDFASKVKKLDRITSILTEKDQSESKKWKKVASYIAVSFAVMLFGHFILSYLQFNKLAEVAVDIYNAADKTFWIMVLAGFAAQMVDGATSMGYGVTSTMILLSTNVSPAAISGSIHTAEIFASGASGYSHYKFGNVNKKMFKALVVPGVIGAVLGAVMLVGLGQTHIEYLRPIMASYTLILGIRILINAFKSTVKRKKFKHYGWLAGAGGFLDSFGGGGWGPLVSATLLTKGRTLKYVVGSVSLTEFFVTIASAFTFFVFLGVQHWQVIVGLIIGGLLAAPIAARITGKLPRKTSFILLGGIVIIWSVRLLVKVLD